MFAQITALGFIVSAIMIAMIINFGILMGFLHNINQRLKTVQKKDRDIQNFKNQVLKKRLERYGRKGNTIH